MLTQYHVKHLLIVPFEAFLDLEAQNFAFGVDQVMDGQGSQHFAFQLFQLDCYTPDDQVSQDFALWYYRYTNPHQQGKYQALLFLATDW